MPAEDEYGPTSTSTSRRQLLLHHVPAAVSPVPSLPPASQGPTSSGAAPSPSTAGTTPPVAVTCPAGCPITPVERLQVRNLYCPFPGGLYDYYVFLCAGELSGTALGAGQRVLGQREAPRMLPGRGCLQREAGAIRRAFYSERGEDGPHGTVAVCHHGGGPITNVVGELIGREVPISGLSTRRYWEP